MGIVDDIKEQLVEAGYERSRVKEIIQSLREDAQEMGKTLKELISSGGEILSDLDVNLVSGVHGPAQPSNWWLLKSVDGIVIKSNMVFKSDSDERQISYAPVLVPGIADKQDDIIPSCVIEESAHRFLKSQDRDAIDVNHDEQKGRGYVVESWITKKSETFKDRTSDMVEYPKGTWMMAVQWDNDAWELVKDGEIEGFSIMGRGNGIELGKFINNDFNKNSDINKETGEFMADESEEEEEEVEDVEENEQTDEPEEQEEQEQPDMDLDEISDRLDSIDERVSEFEDEFMSEDTPDEKQDDDDEDDEEEEQQEEPELGLDDLITMIAEVLDVPVDDVASAIANLKEEEEEEPEEEEEKSTERDTSGSYRKALMGEGIREDFVELSENADNPKRGSYEERFRELEEGE